jgi:periplasmic protein TonB
VKGAPAAPSVRKRRLPPFETGLLASLLLHVAVWQLLTWKHEFPWNETADEMEIDLTRPFRITSNPLLARRAENPGVGAPVVDTPKPLAGVPAPKAPEWTLPSTPQQEVAPPAATGGGSGGEGEAEGGLGGLGRGSGSGEVDWVYLTDLPRMLNRDELLRNIRRFYPEAERRAGREGQVTLDVRIARDGTVTGADVALSGGAAFDEAAKKVLREARFSPARVGAEAVPVKIRQTIAFRLDE